MQKSEILKFLTEHKAELRKNFGVTNIGLCGSYVRNENRTDSDIDLIIDMESERKDIHNYLALKRSLENQLNARVDIGFENAIKPAIKSHIMNEIEYV